MNNTNQKIEKLTTFLKGELGVPDSKTPPITQQSQPTGPMDGSMQVDQIPPCKGDP